MHTNVRQAFDDYVYKTSYGVLSPVLDYANSPLSYRVPHDVLRKKLIGIEGNGHMFRCFCCGGLTLHAAYSTYERRAKQLVLQKYDESQYIVINGTLPCDRSVFQNLYVRTGLVRIYADDVQIATINITEETAEGYLQQINHRPTKHSSIRFYGDWLEVEDFGQQIIFSQLGT